MKNNKTFRFNDEYNPNYENMHDWELYSSSIDMEYQQLSDEGKDVSVFKKAVDVIHALPRSKAKEELAVLLGEHMHSTETVEGYPYVEPSDLAGIQAERKTSDIPVRPVPDTDILRDKIHGAWLGRICGCRLGATVECIMSDDMEYLLKATDNYPLSRYILRKEMNDDIYNNVKYDLKSRTFSDEITHAPIDDDTNYTVMAALVIKRNGRDFTPQKVAATWLYEQPVTAYCTAERVAYINLINGFPPPASAMYKNPHRELIGAQIRGDYFGYINPGNPELAADMAWRDACISHVKNGIYGEMLVAAMLAHAAVIDDIVEIIERGLAEIPQKSRLYEHCQTVLGMFKNGATAKECFAYVNKHFDEKAWYGWTHTISNALIVIISLLYGNLDYSKSICLAVGACFDTDCNGATVGSIVGMVIGAKNIPAVWSEPINNTLETSLSEMKLVKIDELVELTMKHVVK